MPAGALQPHNEVPGRDGVLLLAAVEEGQLGRASDTVVLQQSGGHSSVGGGGGGDHLVLSSGLGDVGGSVLASMLTTRPRVRTEIPKAAKPVLWDTLTQ